MNIKTGNINIASLFFAFPMTFINARVTVGSVFFKVIVEIKCVSLVTVIS